MKNDELLLEKMNIMGDKDKLNDKVWKQTEWGKNNQKNFIALTMAEFCTSFCDA